MDGNRATTVVTVVTSNCLAGALSLSRSLRHWHPDWRLVVWVIDPEPESQAAVADELDCRDASRLVRDGWGRFSFQYTPLELACALKPAALRQALDDGAARAIWLDTDIILYGPLDEVAAGASDDSICLTPHLTRPLREDGTLPSDGSILRSGIYNAGFVAVSATTIGRDFLDWWGAHCRTESIVDIATGLFVDQKWLDLVPVLFDQVRVHRRVGFHTAYWNLDGRRVERDAQGLTVDGERVVLFHFSGVDRRNPESLSKYQDRIRLDEHPVVAEELRRYLTRLDDCGADRFSRIEYRFGRLSDGRPIEEGWREAVRRNDPRLDPFDDPRDVVAHPELPAIFESLTAQYARIRADWCLRPIVPERKTLKRRVRKYLARMGLWRPAA
ncbi:MAG TPA: hypothetical protein PLI18_00630 [Pirellulaceae bacterium]|nr:hypothetical protein [Pirellulaceae bacterium]